MPVRFSDITLLHHGEKGIGHLPKIPRSVVRDLTVSVGSL